MRREKAYNQLALLLRSGVMSWQVVYFFMVWGCGVTCPKIPYHTAKVARRQRKFLELKYGVPQYVYECPVCNHLHTTSQHPGTMMTKERV